MNSEASSSPGVEKFHPRPTRWPPSVMAVPLVRHGEGRGNSTCACSRRHDFGNSAIAASRVNS
jgi:hypothetical protein